MSVMFESDGGIGMVSGYRRQKRRKVVVVCWDSCVGRSPFNQSASTSPATKKAAASQAWQRDGGRKNSWLIDPRPRLCFNQRANTLR